MPFEFRFPAINPVRQDNVVDGLFFANPRQSTVKQKFDFLSRHDLIHHEIFVKQKVKPYGIKSIMPQTPKYKLKTPVTTEEHPGQRIAQLRKEKGLTQVQLAKAIGIRQVLISDYERRRLRPNYEMIVQFAMALDVSTDELLGLKVPKNTSKKPSLKILKRMNKIEELPPSQQRALLQTIDNFLKGVEANQ